MIMVGHLIHPRFSDGDRPTSLSRRAITEELRGALGFDGLVVTDDLGMDAIARRFSPEEAAEMAIRAGADILIFANLPAEDPGALDRIVATVAGAVVGGPAAGAAGRGELRPHPRRARRTSAAAAAGERRRAGSAGLPGAAGRDAGNGLPRG